MDRNAGGGVCVCEVNPFLVLDKKAFYVGVVASLFPLSNS
jgi:hypothetical protein